MTEIDKRIRELCDKIKRYDVRCLDYEELRYIEEQLEIADLLIILLKKEKQKIRRNKINLEEII